MIGSLIINLLQLYSKSADKRIMKIGQHLEMSEARV